MDITKVTSKGQITIPKEVRRKLGIRQGSRLVFKVLEDRAELSLAVPATPAAKSGFGLLKSKRRSLPADMDPAGLLNPRSRAE